jgi:hypothetical protein
MTPAQHVVLAAIDAVNAGDPHGLDGLVSAEFVDHDGLRGENAADAGVRYEVHDVFGSGDRVAVRATGGKLAAHWCIRDDVTLLRQVGVLADPA